MRRNRILSPLALGTVLVFAGAARGQVLEMGNTIASPNASDVVISETRTDIDLVTPATATGTIDSATFTWGFVVCGSAAKIKVFRRHGDALLFVAERGPFDVTVSPMTVALTPPIAVEEGDLLGIARVANCGNPMTLTGIVSAGYAAYVGDISANVFLSGADAQGSGILSVHATGTATETIARVVPAAGSTPGDFGSFFRTGVQLTNPFGTPLSGRFVYHPAGVPGTSSDPSLSFNIDANATISYDDLVQSMGQSGLGTLDLVLPAASAIPVIVARVYNDASAAGTAGFTEEAMDPTGSFESRVLFGGATGFLTAPSNVTNFRFNIGVRSLLSGASITFRVRDASGAIVRTVTKDYAPTVYEQQPASTLLGGPIGANDSIEVSVGGGSAIVYGATADNRTQDPSVQFARVAFAIL
ncbi:MAG: hypothetical protein WAU32_05600 [Thermoanaerobaculia bacterium]